MGCQVFGQSRLLDSDFSGKEGGILQAGRRTGTSFFVFFDGSQHSQSGDWFEWRAGILCIGLIRQAP